MKMEPRAAGLQRAFALAAVFALLLCAGCASSGGGNPTAALAVDGPPLAVVGEYDGMRLEGTMDRTCMAGYGQLLLFSPDTGAEFTCEAAVDSPPTDKARIRGILDCSQSRILYFSLRNLGPDQGVGIARSGQNDALMIFFYHPSAEEAKRRFPGVRADIEAARQQAR